MDAKTPQELWLLELEMERFSTAWKQKPAEPAPQPTVVVQKVFTGEVDKKAQRERDKVMFHAGRYAEGARDEEATAANAKIGGYINGKRK